MNSPQQEEEKKKAKEYEDYVKTKTPAHSLAKNMGAAFLCGGLICVLGQAIMNFCQNAGLDKETSGSWTSLLLVLLSVVLTGFNLYPKIAKWGGAGTLVPITGFANSVVSPAIEFKAEGWVTGIGAKIFGIAGPVIAYGTAASAVWGVLYWLMGKVG